ncbi:MAG: iron ABC transporter permease [Spongiibacteraceae bacterium]|nr:iron ABC transporter permease [Spongiibacteraceae bacterium]
MPSTLTQLISSALAGGHSTRRRQSYLKTLSKVAGVSIVVIALVPVCVIVLSWCSDQTQVWQHLIATQLSTLIRNSVVLVVGVGVGVTLLGVSLAWLTVMCEFPGRRYLDWALMSPMAMPAYVLAFVVLGLFDFTGPLQQGLRELFGESFQTFDIRTEGVVVAVLVLVFYPYVYMLARSAFLAQSCDVMEAAQILGMSRWGAFWRVALPMARPAIVAGASLAIMETLADFGTVAVFNYDTFTTAIYKSWFGLFNIYAAAQLASLLLLFVGLGLFAEKRSRGRRNYRQSARLQHRFRQQLPTPLALAATVFCFLVLLVAFIIPVCQLLYWVLHEGFSAIDPRYLNLLWRTLLLGALAAMITVVFAVLLAFSRRKAGLRLRSFYGAASLGYALPGSVLAVGIMLSFAFIDKQVLAPVMSVLGLVPRQLLVGSVLALLAAYWIRFLAVAGGPVESSLQRIRDTIPEAAKSLGANEWQMLWRIYLPMLRPGILTALVLVFVDVMKEMPATLLLRPFGWDTLAVRIYEMTSEGEWHRAALPALTLVLIGLIPVLIAVKKISAR